MANKFSSFGAELKVIISTTPTLIAGVRDISGPSMALSTVDATAHDSTDGFREFVPGLADGGEVSFELVFDPKAADHEYLHDALAGRTEESFQLIFTDTGDTEYHFDGYVTAFEPGAPVEGFISANVTIKVTGEVEFDA